MMVAFAAFALLPFVVLPLVDAYEPGRTIAVACASLAILAFRPSGTAAGRAPVAAFWLAAALAAWTIFAALSSQPASSIFGVHGRYQGLVSQAALMAAGGVGVLASHRIRRAAITPFGVAALCVVAVASYQSLSGFEPVALMGNRVIAGAWLSVVAGVLVGAAFVAPPRSRVALGLAASSVVVALGAVGSRGAWVGLAVAIISLLLALRGRAVTPKRLLAVGLGVALAAGVVLGGAESVRKADPRSLAGGSAAARLAIWSDTAVMIGDHPVFGVGPGRFLYAYPRYESAAHASAEGPGVRADQAHSLLLHEAAEAGLPAALLLMALAGLALFQGYRAARRGDGIAVVLLAGFVAYVGQALFGVAAIEVDALGWLLGGALIARSLSPEKGSARPVDASVRIRTVGRLLRGAAVASALLSLTASLWYIAGEASYSRSIESFEAGDMAAAYLMANAAVDRVPVVDVYRVALADAAAYRGGSRAATLRRLDAGLSIEQDSYDLALSRARLLKLEGAESGTVAEAYLRALRLYPRVADIRSEASIALDAAGDAELAREVAEGAIVSGGSGER